MKTMAQILAEHDLVGHARSGHYACSNTECGWEFKRYLSAEERMRPINTITWEFATHQEDMLVAESFGALADGWDAGFEEATEHYAAHQYDPNSNGPADPPANPYRKNI